MSDLISAGDPVLNTQLANLTAAYLGQIQFWDTPNIDCYNTIPLNFSITGSTTGQVQVPEPAALFLLGLGLVGLAGVKRKFNK